MVFPSICKSTPYQLSPRVTCLSDFFFAPAVLVSLPSLLSSLLPPCIATSIPTRSFVLWFLASVQDQRRVEFRDNRALSLWQPMPPPLLGTHQLLNTNVQKQKQKANATATAGHRPKTQHKCPKTKTKSKATATAGHRPKTQHKCPADAVWAGTGH